MGYRPWTIGNISPRRSRVIEKLTSARVGHILAKPNLFSVQGFTTGVNRRELVCSARLHLLFRQEFRWDVVVI